MRGDQHEVVSAEKQRSVPAPSLLWDDIVHRPGASSRRRSADKSFVHLLACRPGLARGNPDLSLVLALKEKEINTNCLFASFVFMV